MNLARLLIVSILSTLLLTSCTMLKETFLPEHRLVVMTQTSKNLNPDENGRPSPLLVYLVQLKSADTFRSADFFALYDTPKQTLGADYIAISKLNLTPSTTGRITLHLHSGVNFVGIIAGYHDQQDAVWRVEVPITSDWGREKIHLSVGRDAIHIYTVLLTGDEIDVKRPKVNVGKLAPKGSNGPDVNYEVLSYLGPND